MVSVWKAGRWKTLLMCYLVGSVVGSADAQSPFPRIADHLKSAPSTGRPPDVDRPLLAHWPFDEPGESAIIQERSGKAPLGVTASRPIARMHAVHDRGLLLSGQHALRVDIGSHLDPLTEITFAAWVRPTDLSGYREIFRQECPQRLLFSFQNGGTILSLGLNVDGYEECDAEIRPESLLDGTWHHCAATFDGRMMRVFLDGQLIGERERPGSITTDASAPGFIGSSNGTGEFFQGGIDDLRIYRGALTSDQINAMYRWGTAAIEQYTRRLVQALPDLYVKGDSFAETVGDVRLRLADAARDLRPILPI